MSTLLKLICAVLIASLCGCAPGGGRVCLLDDQGKSLEPWWHRTSYDLGDAAYVIFDGEKYETPDYTERLTDRAFGRASLLLEAKGKHVPHYASRVLDLRNGKFLSLWGLWRREQERDS
jgi:hypothetical protein